MNMPLAGSSAAVRDEDLQDWLQLARRLEREVGQAIVGQAAVIRLITTALFARGHVLLEGDVGVGKTTLLRAFARAIGGEFERVEGTVDMMPSDLVYHAYVDAQGKPGIEAGPLLHHGERLTTFFFNEINRARPQVQSLLLRAMAERTVAAFNRSFAFPHMCVFADRNRVEREETFELASAARDRFLFELRMPGPEDYATQRTLLFDPDYHDTDTLLARVAPAVLPWQELNSMAHRIQRSVAVSEALERYVIALWEASRAPARFGVTIEGVDMGRLILAGASPRGMMALTRAARVAAWLDGRRHVLPDDVIQVAPSTLVHRIFFTPVYEARRTQIADTLVAGILSQVAAPRPA